MSTERAPRERLLRTADLAELFDVEAETVIAWARAGRVPYLRTPGGQYRFRPDCVDALLAAETPAEQDEPALDSNEPAQRSSAERAL